MDKLDFTPDVLEEVLKSLSLPSKCKFIQAAIFTDGRDALTLSYAKWTEALGTDKDDFFRILFRQLITHETIYKIARERTTDVSSARARYIVALMYSDYQVPPALAWNDPEFDRGYQRYEGELERQLEDLWRGRAFQPIDSKISR